MIKEFLVALNSNKRRLFDLRILKGSFVNFTNTTNTTNMDVKMEVDIKPENCSKEASETEKTVGTIEEVKDESSQVNSKAAEESNPLAYLKRDEFSSERFKIEINGLPKYFGFTEIKKLLNNRLQLNAHKIKPLKGGYMFVNFRSDEERQKAVDTLNGYKWKSKILGAKFARAADDPLIRKRAHEEIDKGSDAWQNESIEDSMKRLKKKMEATNNLVVDLTQKIQEVNPLLTLEDGSDKICPVDDIIPSPVTEAYRNKCEFAIGYNPVTSEKMVGFRVSSYKQGSVGIGPVDHLIHLPPKMIQGALAFQNFVRSSEFNPYEQDTHLGVWKQLMVRTTVDGQLMLVVLISQRQLKPEDLVKINATLKSTFEKLEDPKIDSFYTQIMETHGQKQANMPELLFGEECITESVLGLNFKMSPEAFFQVNIKAAEILYSTLGTLLESNPETTLLDVCCGTGTIGLCLASKCGQVLGIEMVASAVQDAQKNAQVNGLSKKCEFFAGKAEDVLEAVLTRAKYENIVAVVDPPRAGLHQRVLLLLRRSEKIKTIIYVSCDARAATKNFVDLTRPISKVFKGVPFFPKKIIPVDLFPHCHHSELVLLFERESSTRQVNNDDVSSVAKSE